MKPDGSDKKQVTKTDGYDGGAVFSRDGKHLVWRANHPLTPETEKRYHDLLSENLTSPMKMELFVATARERTRSKITNFGCASFAPTFTPDGKKILFASNKHDCDGRKFELYLVNTDGTNLEQVTDFGGFTAFPSSHQMGRRSCSPPTRARSRHTSLISFTADWK